jgi:hypothetical protein
MPGGIDYSKWDKIDYGSDDESSNAEDDTPRVTRLDESSAVTFSSKGVDVKPSQHLSTQSAVVKPLSKDVPTSEPGTQLERSKTILTKNGSTYIDPETKNEIYWCQDRNEAILSIRYDHESIQSKDIRVDMTGALKYEDRHAAVGVDSDIGEVKGSQGKIVVSAVENSKSRIILQGYLGYPIHLSENESEVDWEIDVTDPNMKMIRVSFQKSVPMQGLTVWWSRPLLHFPEIDVVSDIEGRNKVPSNECSGEKNEHDEWKRSWDEAHKMFRENVKNRGKEVIDIHGD